jgi:8-oxo-dGTP pyrophosphatase MutT (NUDIX family)
MSRAIQRFEVSLKAFIIKNNRALLVQEADTRYWELPGGRINVGEERLAHADILAREIVEELGANFHISSGDAAVTWVRQRPSDGVFQFVVARVCRHISGEPALSPEHCAHLWATPAEWQRLDFPPLSDYPVALAQLSDLAVRLHHL